MTYPEISLRIIETKEQRSMIYPEINSVKAAIKSHGDKHQSAPEHLVARRDELQADLSDLTQQLDRLQHQKLVLVHQQTEREKYHGAIRKITTGMLANPDFRGPLIPQAIALEEAIRELPVPQS